MASKTIFRKLDGILLLDKPRGLSSNQALQRVRRVPELRFRYDDSVDRGERIDALLRGDK